MAVMDKSYSKAQKIIVGVDPGDTTGVAVVEPTTGMILWGVHLSGEEDIIAFLSRITAGDVVAIIVEDFQLLPHKAKAKIGSKFKTVQVIGQFKLWGKMHDIPLYTQSPSIKPIAQKFSKQVPTGSHEKNHWIDAYNHAFYWMVRRGYVEPKSR